MEDNYKIPWLVAGGNITLDIPYRTIVYRTVTMREDYPEHLNEYEKSVCETIMLQRRMEKPFITKKQADFIDRLWVEVRKRRKVKGHKVNQIRLYGKFR